MSELVESLGKDYMVLYPKNNSWDMYTLGIILNNEKKGALSSTVWYLVLRNQNNRE